MYLLISTILTVFIIPAFARIENRDTEYRRLRRESILTRRIESLIIRVENLEVDLRKEQENNRNLKDTVTQLRSYITQEHTGRSVGILNSTNIENNIVEHVTRDIRQDLITIQDGLQSEKYFRIHVDSSLEECKDGIARSVLNVKTLKRNVAEISLNMSSFQKEVKEMIVNNTSKGSDQVHPKDWLTELLTGCAHFSAPDNGLVHFEIKDEGGVKRQIGMVTCDPGYAITGSRQRYCQLDQSWNGTRTSCRMTCASCITDVIDSRVTPEDSRVTPEELVNAACHNNISYAYIFDVVSVKSVPDVPLQKIFTEVKTSLKKGGSWIYTSTTALVWRRSDCLCPPLIPNKSYLVLTRELLTPTPLEGMRHQFYLNQGSIYAELHNKLLASYFYMILEGLKKPNFSKMCQRESLSTR